MTKRKIYPFAAIVLCLTMAFSFVTFPVTASAADQPFMKAARDDLNKAQSNLRKATADKGGHRAKALDLIAKAINKVNQGINYARRNDTGLPDISEELNPAAVSDQPFMEKAKDNLQAALDNLQRATDDKGGYKADAISLVHDAISEVNQGIEYDRTH